MARLHQNNFGTNLTSATNAGDTTSPLNSIPSIAAPFYIAFDATNINGHYEVKDITSKTATNVLHSALSYAHTTDEEVRMVVPAVELDAFSAALSSTADGWTSVSDTWTYASASTITVPSGAASLYQIGDRVGITQTTAKYFYVTAVADTLLTVNAGSDYTVANAAITSPKYSHQSNPVGFPGNFNWSPARAVSGGTVPTYTSLDLSYFRIEGSMLYGNISWSNLAGGTAGAGANGMTFTLPVAVKSTDFASDRNTIGSGWYGESGGTNAPATILNGTSASQAEFLNMTSNVLLTGADQSSTNRTVNCALQYRIS